MKKLLLGILFVLLSFFAYNAYTYHQLSLAEGAYKLAEVPSNEKMDNDDTGPYTGVGYFMEVSRR
ncbi:hypothetical protein [Thermococcus sp.]|uniref:hypothetical protein n=1 Tax=Thermococcus sp. TaxID=35749 RepID=UPI00260A627F|nr:hypothetical protein [Thermococcus sp.]